MRYAAALLPLLLIVAAVAVAGDIRAPRAEAPVIRIEQGGACVAPTVEMRRDHMKMLVHQRDQTVREGLRDPRFSLKNCVECHAGRDTGSVLGKEGFCASCHAFAAVKIDCFECHSALRQGLATAVPR